MKRTMLFVFVMLMCVIIVGSALADKGCGNEHYFDCGGGIGNDARCIMNQGQVKDSNAMNMFPQPNQANVKYILIA